MNLKTSIILLLLISSSAQAEISEADARKAKIEGYSLALVQQAQEADKIKGEISAMKKDLEQTQKDARTYALGVVGGVKAGEDTGKLRKDLTQILAHKTSVEKQLAAKTELLQKTTAAYEENKAVVEKTIKEGQAAGKPVAAAAVEPVKDLSNKVTQMGVSQKLTDAKVGLLEVDKQIMDIERKLDQADVGIYVKDKVGQLINSQLLCYGVNRCIKGKEAMPVSPDKVNEIFKNNTKGRSEYYYQMRGTSSPEGTR